MRTLVGRNVSELFASGVSLLMREGVRETSRAGDVLVLSCPVMSVYERPCERVLLDPVRDANPFFHFFESLWMLRGCDDAAYLNNFVRDFGDRYAEENGSIHDAYGWRWRYMLGFDQLEVVVSRLKKEPDTRQAVLQMWDARPAADGMDDLCGDWKARPCNTHVYLRVREEVTNTTLTERMNIVQDLHRYLDLTVLCRSNDIVWGAYGANAVHFSMLQEYLAGKLGVGVGRMYQFSNNWHGYVSVVDSYVNKRNYVSAVDSYVNKRNAADAPVVHMDLYASGHVRTSPIMTDPSGWDLDMCHFLAKPEAERRYANPWFETTAAPMWMAHALWKLGKRNSAIDTAATIASSDWRRAATEWMQRRMR